MTHFQRRVLEAVRQIPEGRVTSYGYISHYLDVRSAQAVGQALKRNPSPVKIPCHRVICQNGFIGYYLGKKDEKKRVLLKKAAYQQAMRDRING